MFAELIRAAYQYVSVTPLDQALRVPADVLLHAGHLSFIDLTIGAMQAIAYAEEWTKWLVIHIENMLAIASSML